MRILQVCPRYYQSVGGVEYTVKRLAEGMKNRGHDVTVVCGNSSIKDAEVTKEGEIELLKVPTYAPGNAYHIPKDRKVVEEFIGKDVDIVHTHSVHAMISMLPLAFKKSLKPKWKLVYSMHFSTSGYTFLRRVLWRLFWRRRINSSLRYVDAIHSTSVLESNVIMEQFSNAEGKVVLIPLGLDEDVFRYSWKGKDSNYVLYCGRVEKYKRIDLAVKSIKHVRKQGHDVKFFIVGDGSRTGYFRKMAENNGWINFMQPKPRREYFELLSNARAVINLSSAENFNLFLAEACAVGVPIVATSEAAAFCPEFANVNSLKPSAVASVIIKALLDPETFIFPKKCVPEPWGDVIEQFESFYRKVLDGVGAD
jgi:glycosyltransferase involved in cell wall biosynthesis